MNYVAKWTNAYRIVGVDIRAVAPQNELEDPTRRVACVFTKEEPAKRVDQQLNPKLRAAQADALVLPFDHNKGRVYT